jgi:hypothetical protein
MLLKLPVELIERVVRFTTPDEITSKTYQQRQDALLSLCLVNSLLLDIARPVLEENWLVKDEIWWWNRLRDHSQSRAPQRLRFLWILASKQTLQWIEVEWALELRPNPLKPCGTFVSVKSNVWTSSFSQQCLVRLLPFLDVPSCA